jgi:TolA-binding protein
MKSSVTQIQNSVENHSNRLNQVEDKILRLEDKIDVLINSDEDNEKDK